MVMLWKMLLLFWMEMPERKIADNDVHDDVHQRVETDLTIQVHDRRAFFQTNPIRISVALFLTFLSISIVSAVFVKCNWSSIGAKHTSPCSEPPFPARSCAQLQQLRQKLHALNLIYDQVSQKTFNSLQDYVH